MEKQAYKIDTTTLLRYLLGGGIIGAGLGASTSLKNHARDLSRKKKRKEDTSYDDDTLYIDLPQKAAALLDSSGDYSGTGTTLAASLLASVLGGIGSYQYVRNRYIDKKKKRLQKELDEKQNVYLNDLALTKGASQFGPLSRVSGSAGALLLLSALGAAATTNKVLSHYFPGYEKAKPLKAKRVVVRRNGKSTMEKTDDTVEQAGPAYSNITPDEIESMLNLKSASCGNYGTVDGIIRTAALVGIEPVKDMVKAASVEEVFEMTKQARHANRFMTKLAARAVCEDPMLGALLAPFIAADLSEDMPSFCKTAANIGEDDQATLINMFTDMNKIANAEDWLPVVDRLLDKAVASNGMNKEAASRQLAETVERIAPPGVVTGMLLADFLSRKAKGDGAEEVQDNSTLSSPPGNASEQTPVHVDDVDDFIADNPELLQEILAEIEETKKQNIGTGPAAPVSGPDSQAVGNT